VIARDWQPADRGGFAALCAKESVPAEIKAAGPQQQLSGGENECLAGGCRFAVVHFQVSRHVI
jgi:hypothetical protein